MKKIVPKLIVQRVSDLMFYQCDEGCCMVRSILDAGSFTPEFAFTLTRVKVFAMDSNGNTTRITKRQYDKCMSKI